MKRINVILTTAALAVLILNSREAARAAAEGVELCLKTAVPSLFPFFVLSAMLVPHCTSLRLPRLGRILGFPKGWESIFILGCVGGYPVGAQCVCQGYTAGALEETDARRMIPLCSNCGPSFLFGIVAVQLGSASRAAWVWVICILSSVFTALILSGRPTKGESLTLPPISLPQAVQRGCRAMISVCAWIILGKVLISFLPAGIFLSGLLELTNGCLSLSAVNDEGTRFILACLFCSFGGICVAMQVFSLCDDAGLSGRGYLACKILQGALSAVLAHTFLIHPGVPVIITTCTVLLKIAMEKTGHMMYNTVSKGGIFHVVPKKDSKVMPVLHPQHKAQ